MLNVNCKCLVKKEIYTWTSLLYLGVKKKNVGKYFCVGNLSEKPKRGERRIRMVNIGKLQQRRKKSKIIIFFLVEPDFLIYGTAYFQWTTIFPLSTIRFSTTNSVNPKHLSYLILHTFNYHILHIWYICQCGY